MSHVTVRVTLALAIGVGGALVFGWLSLPLPWMLGAMTATTVAALLGAPVAAPLKIRPVMFAVLGVMLGSTFAPEMLDRAAQWLGSLALLAAYITVTAAIAYPYFRKFAGLDPITAYFCAMPGSLSQMVPIGAAMGGDEGKIGLIHGSRVLLVVFAIPFWFQFSGQLEGVDRSTMGVGLGDVAPVDLSVLAVTGALGWAVAHRLRLPSAAMIGPLFASVILHVADLSHSQPPRELVNLAQLVIGASVGCRFAGTPAREVLRALATGIGLTAIMLGTAAVFAVLVNTLTGAAMPAAILAFSPGGLPEMTLMALALGVDVAFVATHHVVRILIIVTMAPLVIRTLRKIGEKHL